MLQAFGTYSHLWASTVAESARSSPAKRCAGERRRRGGQPVGAVDVQPHVALRADVGERRRGRRPRRSASCRRSRRRRPGRCRRGGRRRSPPRSLPDPSGGSRRSRSCGRCRSRCPAPRRRGAPSSAPRPSSRARAAGRRRRRWRMPGTARSRAAVSAVRFEIVPPPAVIAVRIRREADELADPAHGLAARAASPRRT